MNGTATSDHDSANSSQLMYVNADGDYVIAQTKMRFNYQPGQSTLIMQTADRFHSESGVVKKLGYFAGLTTAPYDGYSGMYWQSDSNGISVNIQKNGGEITQVYQEDWALDRLDGTGPSRINADFFKSQIYSIDFQWLGVGRVRFGLVIDGETILVHEINHANRTNGAYITSPNLPVRYEIRSTGGVGSFRQICSSVQLESNSQINGFLHSFSNGSTYVNASSTANTYPLLAISLKQVCYCTSVFLESLVMLALTNDTFRWMVLLNPTLSAPLTFTDLYENGVEIATGDGVITVTNTGVIMAQGYASGISRAADVNLSNAVRLGVSINGTRDIIVIAARSFTPNANMLAALNWREVT